MCNPHTIIDINSLVRIITEAEVHQGWTGVSEQVFHQHVMQDNAGGPLFERWIIPRVFVVKRAATLKAEHVTVGRLPTGEKV